MTSTSTNGYTSIFKDGKLKPGIYKLQNIVSQTCVDIQEHTRRLYCRPVTAVEGNQLVGLRPLLAQIVVIVTIFGGKFTLLVLDIAYTAYSHESCFNPIVAYRTAQHSMNQGNLKNVVPFSMD